LITVYVQAFNIIGIVLQSDLNEYTIIINELIMGPCHSISNKWVD